MKMDKDSQWVPDGCPTHDDDIQALLEETTLEQRIEGNRRVIVDLAKRVTSLEGDLDSTITGTIETLASVRADIRKLQEWVGENTPCHPNSASICIGEHDVGEFSEANDYEHDPTLMGCPCSEKHEHLISADHTKCEENYTGAINDYNSLIDVLKIALKGLKINATINQQDIAYYAIRGILSQENNAQ